MTKQRVNAIMYDAKKKACSGEITLTKLAEIKARMLAHCQARKWKTLPQHLK